MARTLSRIALVAASGLALLLPGGAPAAPVARPDPTGQRCYGAASRDPGHPCSNPALRLVVFPEPFDALLESSPGCVTVQLTASWWLCRLNARPERPAGTLALIGDSHAGHWRPALNVVANAKGWRGYAITRAGCPFTLAVPRIDGALRRQCVARNRRLLRWFRLHPEVSTAFVAANRGATVVPDRGRGQAEARVSGYLRAWDALPPTVKRVVVLRDVPRNTTASLGCVDDALAARRRAGPACAVPRRFAVQPDPQLVAAARRPRRARVVDLTRFFCSSRLCFPVIGGALVHKDADHLTAEFSASLGPYLLGRVGGLLSAAG